MPKRTERAKSAGRRRLPACRPSRSIIMTARVQKDRLGQGFRSFASGFRRGGASGRKLEH
jgi:hypothetical protein